MKVLFPSKPLSPYVEAYYSASGTSKGDLKMHFPASTSGYIKFSHTVAIVSGQTTGSTAVNADFSDTGFAVKLRVGALYCLFGVPACELTNQVFRLKDLLGSPTTEFTEQIVEVETFSTQVKNFERVLSNHIQRNCDNGKIIEKQAITFLQKESRTAISQLAQELGYSSRQLQRKFNEFVGLSPRLFRRISRFERTLDSIQLSSKAGSMNWSALALASGYSDQAHLIREFNEFTGGSPMRYLASS